MSNEEQLPALPPDSPIEGIFLSPEMLEVANCYLQTQNIREVASELEIDVGIVSNYLAKPEVKRYIDQVFLDVGFNNRDTIRRAMDAVIRRKFQDMEESETGSVKDITDILALSHKMTMDHIEAQIKLEKIKAGASVKQPKTQVNVQVNNSDSDVSNYDRLLQKLMVP